MSNLKKNMTDILLGSMGLVWGIIILGAGLIQIYLGFLGIDYHLGSGFAFGALGLAFFLRIMFPLTIGTYFGVVDVLGWDWYLGVIIALPGVLFILPGLVTVIFQSLFNRNRY